MGGGAEQRDREAWRRVGGEVMPRFKAPRSLESLSCDLVLGLLYHLTIRHDTDVTQSGLTQYSHGRLEILPYIFQIPY